VRCFDKNIASLNEVRRQFDANQIPTFSMDVGLFQYSRPFLYELISKVDDIAAIEHARYECTHFDQKLEMLRGPLNSQFVDILSSSIAVSARAHIKPLEEAMRKARGVAEGYQNG